MAEKNYRNFEDFLAKHNLTALPEQKVHLTHTRIHTTPDKKHILMMVRYPDGTEEELGRFPYKELEGYGVFYKHDPRGEWITFIHKTTRRIVHVNTFDKWRIKAHRMNSDWWIEVKG